MGYCRMHRLREDRWYHWNTDRYKVCWSLTGEEIKTYSYSKHQYYEEERMIEIAENVAVTTGVQIDTIALTKDICKDSGKIMVKVTVCAGETSSTSSGTRHHRR